MNEFNSIFIIDKYRLMLFIGPILNQRSLQIEKSIKNNTAEEKELNIFFEFINHNNRANISQPNDIPESHLVRLIDP